MFSQYYQTRNFTGGVKNKDHMEGPLLLRHFCGIYKANPDIHPKGGSIHLTILAVRAVRLREVQYIPQTHTADPGLELRFKPTFGYVQSVCPYTQVQA